MPDVSAEKSRLFVPVPPSNVSPPPLKPNESLPPPPVSTFAPASPVSESWNGEPVTSSIPLSASWPASFEPIALALPFSRSTLTPSVDADAIDPA